MKIKLKIETIEEQLNSKFKDPFFFFKSINASGASQTIGFH